MKVLVAVIAICVLLSAIFALGFTIVSKMVFGDSGNDTDAPKPLPDNKLPEDNFVYIDTSGPTFSTQVVNPGELMSMEQAIQAVRDSVVEITTETVQSGFGGFSQYVRSGAGSGVIISTGGYIITNNHVIEGAGNITVRLTDGSEYEAKIVGTDTQTDIAVISINPADGVTLSSAIIGNSESLVLGQTVIAIGNPLGELGGTVTDGIISSLAREVEMDSSAKMTLLQTNAAVSPGNSGGGLFDLYGRLIGVVNAKSTGEGIEGISFAIPVDTAWDIAEQLINNGYVSGRPSLGVELKQYSYGYFGDIYYQLAVSETNSESRLKVGDIIASIDGITVSTLGDVSDIFASHEIGDVVTVIVIRGRNYIEESITLVEYIPSSGNKPGKK